MSMYVVKCGEMCFEDVLADPREPLVKLGSGAACLFASDSPIGPIVSLTRVIYV